MPLGGTALAKDKDAGAITPVYDDAFKLEAITLYESTGSLARVSKQLNISKSTLSRWVNGQHADDEIVVAAKTLAVDVRKDVSERLGDLLSDLVDEVHASLKGGLYSSYEKAVMLGIVADKHVNMKKLSELDNAKNVEVHWPVITPLTQDQIEAERARVKADHDAKQAQLEEE